MNELRIPHKLSTNSKTNLPSRFITYDTETRWKLNDDGTKSHYLKVGVARYYERDSSGIHREEFVFYSVNDFWDWVTRRCYSKTCTHLYAHNQQFDAFIVDMFHQLPERGFSLEKNIIDSNIFIVQWRRGEKSDKALGIKSTAQRILALDTLNFFKASVKELGETLGLPKSEVDFDAVSLEDLTEYCKRDVEIIETMLLKWFSFIKEADLGNFQPTLASQALTAFRHRFMHEDIYIHNDQKAIDLERESYRGGRNECFRLGKIDETIHVLDFNSLYPSVMANHVYPTGLKAFTQQNDMRSLIDAMQNNCVIAELWINIKEPILAIRDERLIFPIGKFKGIFCSPEIEMLLNRNCIEKVGRMNTYSYAEIFNEYINFFYEERLKAKLIMDSIFDFLIKILMNALYGKFGQRLKSNEILGDAPTNQISVERILDCTNNTSYMRKTFGGKIFKCEKTKDETFNSFPAIASFCTAYARMRLLEAIEVAGWNNVFYVDTDSLFVNNEGFNALRPMIDPTKLGFMKLVYDADGMTIFGCKDYTINGKSKIKGVSIGRPDTIQLSKNVYEMTKFNKFATSLQQGIIDHVVERRMTKKLSREYTKGIVQPDGKIIPRMIT